MRRVCLFFAVFAVILATPASAADKSPFTMNGWQLHEYNLPKLAEAIKKAPEYGVNFLIFSHELFDNMQTVLDNPKWLRDVQAVGAMADKQGIPYYLWCHEFDNVPDRYRIKQEIDPADPRLSAAGIWFSFRLGKPVNMDDPALREYLTQRYETLFAKFPNAAGVVLTLHESDNKVFRNSEVLSKLSVPDRIVWVTRLVYDVAKKHRKQVILRNFFYEPREMQYFAEAIAKLPDDIILMSKDSVHEFHPFYPPDPMHGDVGKKRQIMECDLGVEKAWSSEGHYAQTDYIRKYLARARDKGMAGAVGRCRLGWDKPFEDSHEVNLYAFSRLMQDPGLSVDTVLNDWAAKRYNAEAAPYVASAMKRTEFIQHHGRWFLGFWLTRGIGAEWGDYTFYFNHLLLRSRFKWTNDPVDKAQEQAMYHPDAAMFARLVNDKEEVIKQTRDSMADLRKADRYLTPQQLAPLEEGFRYLLDAAELEKQWTRAYFGMRMYMDQPTDENEMIVRDALSKLETMDQNPAVNYGRDPKTGHRYNIDKFIIEMQWRLANRPRAIEEDKRILAETAKMMEVEKN